MSSFNSTPDDSEVLGQLGGGTGLAAGLADMDTKVAASVSGIATNAANIATNTADIATNAADIATNVTAIGLNTAHRGITTGNPHSVALTDFGVTSTAAELNYLDGVNGADVARRYFTKIVSTDASGDYQTDGTDDDVQIQAAIDVVEAAGGGIVYLRAGTYVVGTQITVDSANVHIVGEGLGATILQAKTAFTTTQAVINLAASNTSISHLTVDGNKVNQTTENHVGIGLDFGSVSPTNVVAQSCEVKNVNLGSGTTYGSGIYCGDGSDFKVINCYTHDNEGDGIKIVNTDYVLVTNCLSESNSNAGVYIEQKYATITNTTSKSNSGDGMVIAAAYCAIKGCYIVSNTNDGISTGGSESVISNNSILLNGKHGIDCAVVVNSVISNNIISCDTGLDADNTYSGIALASGAGYNVITGNRIKGDGSTNDLAYGIREEAAAANFNSYSNNTVFGADTALISLQGASSTNYDDTGFGLSVFDSGTSVSTGDGTDAFSVPQKLNGWELVDAIASVHTKGVTGTTDVQIRRRRAGTDADMLSTKITIGDEFFARDGVINAANDDVNTGDQIYIDVDAVHSGTAPVGLSVTLLFRKAF